jgi:hypothetical protein
MPTTATRSSFLTAAAKTSSMLCSALVSVAIGVAHKSLMSARLRHGQELASQHFRGLHQPGTPPHSPCFQLTTIFRSMICPFATRELRERLTLF